MSMPATSTADGDPADGAQDLARQHAAGLGRPGAGRDARVDDVDVDRDVHGVRPVEGLGDRVVDDRLGAALLDLAHEVPAQALLLHPREHVDRRPVAAQAHLDEVAAADRARLDQPSHRRPVARQHAPVVGRGVGVRVEVDDPDAARLADLGDRRGRGPGDRVVAAQHDRDRARRRHLVDLAVDERVRAVDPRRDDVGVARVDDVQELERLVAQLERVDRARRVLRLADGPRPEPRAGPVRSPRRRTGRRRSPRRPRAGAARPGR